LVNFTEKIGPQMILNEILNIYSLLLELY